MILLMPAVCFSKKYNDSIPILEKMWSYKRNFAYHLEKGSMNSYMRYTLNTERRNLTMFLVPTLYAFAKGDRKYIYETYGRMQVKNPHKFVITPQIISSNVPHDRQESEAFSDYLTPNIYDMTLYKDKLLSPFYQANRIYYRYTIENDSANIVHVSFRPKLKNTQLVSGYALVNSNTGRIISTTFNGEYDMLKFHVNVILGTDETNPLIPQRCLSDLNFNFMGNRVSSHLLATYGTPTTLPDSLHEVSDRQRMDSLRPIQLREDEKEIYRQFDLEIEEAKAQREAEERDTLKQKKRTVGDVLWNVGDHLVTSSRTEAFGANFTLSPIINPQYLSYSHTRGLSYKLQLGVRYKWNNKRYLTIQPQIGYNFKIKQFFHYTPIRMNYNPKRNGYAEIIIANGNRISNSSILQAIRNMYPDEDFEGYDNMDLDYFTDNYIQASNNVKAFDWLEIKSGIVYHIRKPENVSGMIEFNQPTIYRSFAPSLMFRLSPWRKGPYLTVNYERSIKGIFASTLEYERMEFDVSHKFKLDRLRLVNLKGGFGFYTNNKTTYFLDYANFYDQNLPGGWEDDWTGNFQLVNSEWYNQSRYYVRLNTSYESPLLVFSFLPLLGKHIETERIYLGLLSIQHTRTYAELGYSISTRFLSIGTFASFLNTSFQEFGMKFTFELFRKW